jgi:hypothetical protein
MNIEPAALAAIRAHMSRGTYRGELLARQKANINRQMRLAKAARFIEPERALIQVHDTGDPFADARVALETAFADCPDILGQIRNVKDEDVARSMLDHAVHGLGLGAADQRALHDMINEALGGN